VLLLTVAAAVADRPGGRRCHSAGCVLKELFGGGVHVIYVDPQRISMRILTVF
jgi:hypothetical protein